MLGEFFAHRDHGQFNSIPYSGWQTGFYAQAASQFMPRWRVGLRYVPTGAAIVCALALTTSFTVLTRAAAALDHR